jgi:hypothetical protein
MQRNTLPRIPAPTAPGSSHAFAGKAYITTGHNGSTDKFEDEHYPAYTMGRAAEMIGATAGFLRAIEQARLFEATRSEGGHRRYSRYQLRLAARVRQIADQGTGIEAACRIVILEDQLAEALEINARLQRQQSPPGN